MKSNILILLSYIGFFGLFVQSAQAQVPLSIGYFSQMGYQPGAKVSATFDLQSLSTERQLYVQPQVGFFVRPLNNTNFLAGSDIGIRKQKGDRSFFSAYAIGLYYQHQLQIQSVTVPLGEVNASDNLQHRSYLLPTLNYTFGSALADNLDWYSKLSVGQRFGGGIDSATTLLLELGIQLKL